MITVENIERRLRKIDYTKPSPSREMLEALMTDGRSRILKASESDKLCADSEAFKIRGRTHLVRVQTQYRRNLFVANMHIARGYGLGLSGSSHENRPVNRFSEKFLTRAFDDLLEQCDRENIALDRQIAIQRFYGGLGGVSWEEVCAVLDDICEKHKFNLYAYLPKNYNTNYVRADGA